MPARHWAVTVPALVEADRARVAGLLPPAEGLVVAWHCAAGTRLERGEAVVVWEAGARQQLAAQAELDRWKTAFDSIPEAVRKKYLPAP